MVFQDLQAFKVLVQHVRQNPKDIDVRYISH